MNQKVFIWSVQYYINKVMVLKLSQKFQKKKQFALISTMIQEKFLAIVKLLQKIFH
jgi:hypothetical protein